MTTKRRGLAAGTTLALLLFVGFFDNFTQIPMISPYAVSLGAGPVMAGWIVGIYSLTNMVGNIGAGVVLDRMGRRVPLAVGMAWAGLGLWLYGLVGTPLALFGARAFHGLGGSILVPAIFTLAADTIPEDERSQGMGRIGAMIGIAAIAGPMYSGILRQVWGPNVVFTSVAAIMVLGGLLALTLPETLRQQGDTARSRDIGPVPFTAIPFRIASVSGFAIAFNLGALTLMLPLQMESLGFAASRSGSVFSLFGIVAVAVMLMAGRAGSNRAALAAGFVPVALAFTFLTLGSSSFLMISIGMALYGLGFGIIYPSLNAQVATLYRVEERGRAYGIFYAFYSLGIVIAPPFVGWLSTYVSFGVIYALSALVAALGSACLYHYRHLLATTSRDAIGSAAV